MSVSDTPSGFVTRDVAARLLMISPKRLDQLVGEGWIPRAGRNAYSVPAVVQGYIRSLQSGHANQVRRRAADNPLRDARATEIEICIAAKAEMRISVEEHLDLCGELVAMTRDEFGKLPEEIDPRHEAKAREAVDGIMSRIDQRLAERREHIHQNTKKRRR